MFNLLFMLLLWIQPRFWEVVCPLVHLVQPPIAFGTFVQGAEPEPHSISVGICARQQR